MHVPGALERLHHTSRTILLKELKGGSTSSKSVLAKPVHPKYFEEI